MRSITTIIFLGLIQLSLGQGYSNMKLIKGGTYTPLYGTSEPGIVDDFYLDTYPVTNAEFRAFLDQYPKWRIGNVTRLLADKNYLSNWDDANFQKAMRETPVNSLSWFVARAYCECLGKRLPMTDEWEYAAMADETRMDAREDSLFSARILAGYEAPRTNLKPVGSTFQNVWGVYDLHGLVWEWTEDFNSVLISGESRKDVDTDRQLFCAAGSVGATDLMNYAAFMRYAFRGSLKANYCVRNLGFRCAKDVNPVP